ncbi:protein kinase [Streptomyces sp. NPDC051286]|uniref:serine/threonine-protein kinase n=1 Tax=Streptomyces sp. NPDC051286 TaxID=3365647 RepID=UPI0037BA7A41
MIEPLPAGPLRHIGPYRLLGLLGAGGMGEVYLARQSGAPEGGLVALKTVRADLDLDDGFRTRFRREIGAAGAVRSAYTATLVGGDASGRPPWLTTEYVPGPSLAEAVTRGGPLPEPVVRAMGADLARALADMHAVRVLHRDLKPGNVLLGPDGPKVIDFGIAQAFDATQLTRTGVVVGSPGYISPEHVNGSRALVPASDVFCLGAVLAFAASGRGPFDDSDMAAVIFRIAQGEPELSGVPPQLREVIAQCLHARPEDRPTPGQLAGLLLRGQPSTPSFPWPAGVREQLADYEQAARDCLVAAPPMAVVPPVPDRPPTLVPPSGTVPGRGRSRRALPMALAAVAVTACLLLGYVLWPGLFPPDKGNSGSSGATGPTAGPSPAAVRSKVRAIPRADGGRTGDFGEAAADSSLRPAGWKAWKSTVDGVGDGCSFAESTLLCAGSKGVTALDAADGSRRWQAPKGQAGAAGSAVAGFASGTVYAFVGQALVAYRITDGRELWRSALPDGSVGVGAVQDGDTLYYVARANSGSTGKLIARRLTGDRGELWSTDFGDPRFSLLADGGRLVVVGNDTRIVDGAKGTVEQRLTAADFPCRGPVLRGRRLVCRGATGLLVMDDVTRPGQPRRLAEEIMPTHPLTLVGDDTVVVSDDDHAYAYGLTDGQRKWTTYETLTEMGGVPSVAGSRVLIAEHHGVGAFRLADGEPENVKSYTGWPDTGPGMSGPDLLAVGDLVFLTFRDGTVLSGYAP